MTTNKSIALDVDGVLAGFQPAIIRKAEEMGLDFYDHYSQWDAWGVKDEYQDAFLEVVKDIDQSWEFWFEKLKPLPEAHVPFEVEAYVSARRGVPEGLTEDWLDRHGFPEAPVHIVDDGEEKVAVLRDETGADVFVDDKVETIREIQSHHTPKNDVPFPILFNQPHNSIFGRQPDREKIWCRAYYLPEVPRIAEKHMRTLSPADVPEEFFATDSHVHNE